MRLQLQPLVLLSVSDLLLAACWLVGAALFSRHCDSLYVYCYHLHTVEQVTQPGLDQNLVVFLFRCVSAGVLGTFCVFHLRFLRKPQQGSFT